MQFGVFDDFKGQRTLLLWGDSIELQPLLSGLLELANGRLQSLRLNQLSGASAIGRVVVNVAIALRDEMLVVDDHTGVTVELRCSAGAAGDLADQLASIALPGAVGHHYVDLAPNQPLQVIVSAGEYPHELGNGAMSCLGPDTIARS